MAGLGAQYLKLRGRVWQYRRRVPADLADLDRRGEVTITTRCRDYAAAVVVAERINSELEAFWAALSAKQAPAAASADAARFERAVRTARALGVTYRQTADLARGGVAEIVARLDQLERRNLSASADAVEAVLGGAPKPALLVSQMFATYEDHARDRLIGKSADQLRKWRNPRIRAASNFVAVIGDRALASISRDDALDLRAWWLDRVLEEGLDPGTPNKDFQHLGRMFGAINEAWRLGLDNPFAGLRLSGERHNPRTAYDAEFVRREILPGHRLARLNPEARDIVLMVASTGMRPSEVAALTPERIRFDSNVPHVEVRPDTRQLKSDAAAREMPLVGVALEVMRRRRDGFPRYREIPDSFSATANKALGECGLRPTPAHTVYSLRHTFKDRLIAIEAPPRVQDALMGHAVGEIRYGAGPSLEQRAEWMARVWG